MLFIAEIPAPGQGSVSEKKGPPIRSESQPALMELARLPGLLALGRRPLLDTASSTGWPLPLSAPKHSREQAVTVSSTCQAQQVFTEGL